MSEPGSSQRPEQPPYSPPAFPLPPGTAPPPGYPPKPPRRGLPVWAIVLIVAGVTVLVLPCLLIGVLSLLGSQVSQVFDGITKDLESQLILIAAPGLLRRMRQIWTTAWWARRQGRAGTRRASQPATTRPGRPRA